MLKALELCGFKSFADRTRFDFPPGITVVVGPNGSGKSNIVDGLKWVLGEQSAKSLRGKDMADVIFKGSGGASGRKPSNSAEATIILENSDRRFAYEHDEVRVTRRVFRSGESEYLINNEPVRLKDIRDLFRGTGVGTDAYSLIEQGKVDRMLQSSPRDRRAIFEEAAGISRFKAKKIETQRRLARVEQNLIRLADIVEEVGSRYRSVKAQASKAARYRQYTNRLKRLRTHVAKIDYTFYQNQLEKLSAESEGLETSLQSLATDLEQQQLDLQKLSADSAARQQQYDDAQKRVADVRENIASLQSEDEAKQNRHQELAERLRRLEGQIQGGRQRLEQLRNEETLLEQEVESVDAQHFDLRRQLESAEPEIDRLRQQRLQLDQENQSRRQQHTELLSLVAELASALAAIRTERSSLQDSTKRKQVGIQEQQQQWEQQAQQLERLSAESSELQTQAEQKDSALADLSQEIAISESRLESLRNHQSELKSQQNGDQQRSDVIREMESRLEGVNAGVKQVLEQARQQQPPFDQVVGLVADLVQVDMQHATLIDLALGEVAQHVVTAGDHLIRAVADHQLQIPGRVGILQLAQPTTLGGQSSVAIPGQADVIGRADQMVQARSGYESFVETLLSGTWIVKSLTTALRLREEGFHDVRFVTMAGEIIEADGRVVVGAKSPANNLVSRRSELRLLQNQIEQRQERLESVATELQDLRQQLENQKQSHRHLLAEQKELNDRLQQLERTADQLKSQQDHVAKSLETLTTELEQESRRQEELKQQLEQQELAHTQHQATIASLADQMGLHDQSSQQLEQQQTELEKTVTTAKVKLAKVEQQLDQFAQQKSAIDQAIQERQDGLTELEKEQQQASEEQTLTQTRLQELGQQKEALETERQELESQLELASVNRDEVEQQRQKLVQAVDTLKSQLAKQERRKYEMEGEVNQLTLQRSALIERMRDDYGLEMDEVLSYQPIYAAPVLSEPTSADAEDQSNEVRSDKSEPEDADRSDGQSEEDTQRDASSDDQDAGTTVIRPAATEEVDPELIVSMDRQEVDTEIHQLRRRINSIGAVNLDSLAELEDLETRYNHLDAQYQDLVTAKEGLENIIVRINADSRRIFAETLEIIRRNFQELYRKTFGGGHADIVLDENEDILECGVDIVATPPGKSEFSNSLLSGGEKALTAVSLLMAIFKFRPSPFCVLDEVDAPFDEANIGRFIDVLKDFLGWTRFVIVTHSKKTMTAATTLYGVTMQDSGVSKRVSIKFEEVSEDGELLNPGDPADQVTR